MPRRVSFPVDQRQQIATHLSVAGQKFYAEADTWVFVIAFLVCIYLCPFLHQQRLVVQVIHIFLIVAFEFLVDGLVEIRQIVFLYLLGKVLQHAGSHLLVEFQIPFVVVVFEDEILFFGIVFRSFHL